MSCRNYIMFRNVEDAERKSNAINMLLGNSFDLDESIEFAYGNYVRVYNIDNDIMVSFKNNYIENVESMLFEIAYQLAEMFNLDTDIFVEVSNEFDEEWHGIQLKDIGKVRLFSNMYDIYADNEDVGYYKRHKKHEFELENVKPWRLEREE